MVLSYSIVKKDARDFPYGAFIDSYILNELQKTDINIYGFLGDARRIRLFEAMGNHVAAEYGKLIKKQ